MRTLITQHYNSITYTCCCSASAFLLLFLLSACVRRDGRDNPACQRSNSWTSLYARSDVSIVGQSSIRCCNSPTHCSPVFLLYALFLRSKQSDKPFILWLYKWFIFRTLCIFKVLSRPSPIAFLLTNSSLTF